MQVRPAEGARLPFEPVQLPPDLAQLRRARLEVHATHRAVPARREVHGALAMAEAWRGRIRRGDVQVVDPAEQLDLLPPLRRERRERWSCVAVLVLEVAEDDVRLEDGRAIGTHEARHLLERIDRGKLGRLQLRVGDGLEVDRIRHATRLLQVHPETDSCSVVGVKHVKEDGLLAAAAHCANAEGLESVTVAEAAPYLMAQHRWSQVPCVQRSALEAMSPVVGLTPTGFYSLTVHAHRHTACGRPASKSRTARKKSSLRGRSKCAKVGARGAPTKTNC